MKSGVGIRIHQRAGSGGRLQIAQGRKVDLQVGPGQLRPAANKPAGLVKAQGKRPAARRDVFHAGPELAPPGVELVVQGRYLAAVDQADVEVVLQVPADGGAVQDRGDSETAQLLRGADTGKQEQLGRVHGTGRQHDLRAGARGLHAPMLHVFDADGTPPLEDDAPGFRAGFDTQVAAPACRPEIGARGRHAPPALDRDVIGADAFLPGPVEVGSARLPGLLAGAQEVLAGRMQFA